MKNNNENLRLLKPFLRGLPIIVFVIVLCITLTNRYLKYATPIYESVAKIRLADTKDGSPSANLYKDLDVFANANKIGAELELIKSHVIINKTLDSIGFDISTYRVGKLRTIELYQDCPFKISTNFKTNLNFDKPIKLTILSNNQYQITFPNSDKKYSAILGAFIKYNSDEILVDKNEDLLEQKPNLQLADNYEFVIHSRQKLIEMVLENLEVSSIDKEIPILRLNYKSAVAQKAADFVNALAKTYIVDYIETKYSSANTAVGFLDNQLDSVGAKLSESEAAIEAYKDEKRIINIQQETETDLRKIADMKVQQTNVKMNLEAVEGLYKYMKEGQNNALELAPNFEAYTDLLATELVKKLKLLQSNKKELLLKYTPEHEQVKVIDAQIKDITTYLEEGINNSRKTLKYKYDRLSNDIYDAEQVFNGLPTKEKTMGVLNRNFMLNEQTYNFLHAKRTEADIAKAANISFHRVISPAVMASKPISPNSPLLKILAAFLGFLGSIAIIYLVHSIKGKVNDSHNIEKNSSIPVAVSIARLKKNLDIKNAFQKTIIQLQIKDLLKSNSVIALSSFNSKEGKSFNTHYMASELIEQGNKTLVLDADGELNLENKNRTYDYISLVDKQYANTENLKNSITKWKTEFDIVLIKNENILNASNGLLLMKIADVNLLILDSRRTNAKLITEAEVLQDEYKFNNMNFVLNSAGYNPNVLIESFEFIKHIILKFRK